jgi:hypothetical protein
MLFVQRQAKERATSDDNYVSKKVKTPWSVERKGAGRVGPRDSDDAGPQQQLIENCPMHSTGPSVRASRGPLGSLPIRTGRKLSFLRAACRVLPVTPQSSQSTRWWLAVSPALQPASVEPIVLGALCCLVRSLRVTSSDSLLGRRGLLRWLFSFLQGSATCRMVCISVTFSFITSFNVV